MSAAGVSQELRSLFRSRFGSLPTQVVRAPAGIQLLGCSALLPDGLAVCAALDRHVQIASAPRADGKIELASSAFPGTECFRVDDLKRNPAAPWADFSKAVLAELGRRGVHYSGFSAAILDEVPIGAGLGRFAAVEVAMALTVRRLWPFSLSETGLGPPPLRGERDELPPLGAAEKLSLARLCQMAEERFLGVNSPASGALSSVCGKAWHLLAIDQRFNTVQALPLIGEVFVLCRPAAATQTPGMDVLEARKNCESAARKLRAKSLRSIQSGDLAASRAALEAREFECASFVASEMARVVGAERALRADDHGQFGAFISESGATAMALNSGACAELNLLVELARAHPGCVGARVQGEAVWSIVAHHQVESFLNQIKAAYRERTGGEVKVAVCQTADGAA